MKEELIKALEAERERFYSRGQSTRDHDLTIKYLKTGVVPSVEVEDFDILEAAITDFGCLCRDYLTL